MQAEANADAACPTTPSTPKRSRSQQSRSNRQNEQLAAAERRLRIYEDVLATLERRRTAGR